MLCHLFLFLKVAWKKKQIKFKHFLFVKIRCTIAKYLCTVKLKKTVIMGLLDFLFLARL